MLQEDNNQDDDNYLSRAINVLKGGSLNFDELVSENAQLPVGLVNPIALPNIAASQAPSFYQPSSIPFNPTTTSSSTTSSNNNNNTFLQSKHSLFSHNAANSAFSAITPSFTTTTSNPLHTPSSSFTPIQLQPTASHNTSAQGGRPNREPLSNISSLKSKYSKTVNPNAGFSSSATSSSLLSPSMSSSSIQALQSNHSSPASPIPDKKFLERKSKNASEVERESIILASIRLVCTLISILVVIACFQPNQLMSLHPILMTFSFTFMLFEGILILKDSQTQALPTAEKMPLYKQHLLVQLVTLVCATIGFIVVFSQKLNQLHFISFHATMGIITFSVLLSECALGLYIYLSLLFRNNPNAMFLLPIFSALKEYHESTVQEDKKATIPSQLSNNVAAPPQLSLVPPPLTFNILTAPITSLKSGSNNSSILSLSPTTLAPPTLGSSMYPSPPGSPQPNPQELAAQEAQQQQQQFAAQRENRMNQIVLTGGQFFIKLHHILGVALLFFSFISMATGFKSSFFASRAYFLVPELCIFLLLVVIILFLYPVYLDSQSTNKRK